MESEKDIKKEIRDLAPDFPQPQKTDAPAGYFDQLTDQILSRWKTEQVTRSGSRNKWLRVSGIAATVMILLIGGWLLSKEKGIDHKLAITSEEAYQYVHENIEEFEPLLEDVEVSLTDDEFDVPQDEIRQYLIEETNEEDPEELF